MPSVKVARRQEERTSKVEIVPNPFGGVNTHLLGTRPTSSVLSLTRRLSILSPDKQDVQKTQRRLALSA
jgi:hypothetical protein